MIHLTRDKKTRNYYTKDRKYVIYKDPLGWHVHIRFDTSAGTYYRYTFSRDTLREVRESLEYEYKNKEA